MPESRSVVVVDYGAGNLFSISRALEAVGSEVRIVSSAEDWVRAATVVIPGVGAFGEGMRNLKARGLVHPIREHAESGRRVLGICLGAQLLLETSPEFGTHEGLGLIPGSVESLDPAIARVPHVGWAHTESSSPAMSGWFYFVHSFRLAPRQAHVALATARHGEGEFVAAVRVGKVTGVQFHPEKSGPQGLELLGGLVNGSV
jgi:glutamine amidotransferase